MADQDLVPELDELRRELEAVGMVVVPFRNEIHIRRSTLEYIKVSVDNGVLRCEPWIGALTQAAATWALLAGEMIVILALSLQGTIAINTVMAAFGGLLGFGLHGLRYTLAEITINRVQSVWLDLRNRHRALPAPTPMSLPQPAASGLSEGVAPARDEAKADYVRKRS